MRQDGELNICRHGHAMVLGSCCHYLQDPGRFANVFRGKGWAWSHRSAVCTLMCTWVGHRVHLTGVRYMCMVEFARVRLRTGMYGVGSVLWISGVLALQGCPIYLLNPRPTLLNHPHYFLFFLSCKCRLKHHEQACISESR